MLGKMKRVACDGCGLVNLEGFTTFPRCAACGSVLPEEQTLSFWKRPVKSLSWMVMLGTGAAFALGGVASIWSETQPRAEEKLLIYAQMPRRAAADGFLYARFALDSTEVPAPELFRDVRLRLPAELFENFRLIKIAPSPTYRRTTGGGRYFEWKRLKRDQPITLVLSPRRLGTHEWRVSLYARGYYPFERRGQVIIEAQHALRRGFNARPQKEKARPVPTPFQAPLQTPLANSPSPQPSSSRWPQFIVNEN